MLTKGMQIERVRRILEGGTVSTRRRVTDPEISLALAGANAGLLKADYYNVIMKGDGETAPDGAMIAEYTNLPVISRDKGRSRIKLPAVPTIMPDRQGVFSVYPSGYPELEYKPNAPGQINIMMGEKLMNPLSGSTYSWDSGYVTIYDDLVGRGYSTVDMKLVVSDLSNLDDNDILPMSEDLALQAIIQVVQLYSVEPMTVRADNKLPNPVTQQG